MRITDPIVSTLKSSLGIVNMFLGDLSDADLLVRPVAGANHIAWQLGHLIWVECELVQSTLPGTVYPELPAGFKELHDKPNANRDEGFSTRAFYLDLLGKVRGVTIAATEKLTEADLIVPTEGPMKAMIPTRMDLLLLMATHTIMHAGQFTVVRRKLGKPVLF